MNNKNILVVDDQEDILETIKDVLEDEGYQITTVDNANSADEILKTKNFNLILLDIWMPKKDGITLLEEWSEKGVDIPVIIMSGHGDIKTAVQVTKLGAISFLEKPLDLTKLITTVNEVLKGEVIELNFDLTLKEFRVYADTLYFKHHLKNQRYISKVAEIAGVDRTNIYRRLQALGIKVKK